MSMHVSLIFFIRANKFLHEHNDLFFSCHKCGDVMHSPLVPERKGGREENSIQELN